MAENNGLAGISKLPFSLKVLIENLLRHEDGRSVKADDIRAVVDWLKDKTSTREIAYRPARVLMQDFTGVPAVVDLAAMRDAMKSLGGDPSRINPLVPVDLVIDHSVQVDFFGSADAFKKNVEIEYERNKERYEFLRWGAGAFNNFQVVPPGTGICHQVNLEYLAQTGVDQAGRQARAGLPRHLRRHRQPHHHGQRAGRARLGRRRHRGGGRHARPARRHGHPRGDRLRLQGQAQGGRHRHRPRAHLHADAEEARRGREVRRVLRRRASTISRWRIAPPSATWRRSTAPPAASSPSTPTPSSTSRPPAARPSASPWSRPTARPRGCGASAASKPVFTDMLELDLSTVEPSLAGPKRPQDRVPLTQVKSGFAAVLPDIVKGADLKRRVKVDGRRLRSRPRRRGDRRHHLVHQHLQPLGADRRRPAGAQCPQQGPQGQAVGQDLAGAGLAGGHRLPGQGQPAGRSRRAGLQPGRLRLHHLHRQFRAAARQHRRRRARQRPGGRRRAVGQPQLRGPRQRRREGELSGLPAAGGGLCAGRHAEQGPHHRAAGRGQRRASPSISRTSGRPRPRSPS